MTDQEEKKSPVPDYGIRTVLHTWIDLVHRYPATVLICSTVLTALSLVATLQYLGVDTNTEGMLSDQLKFRKDFEEFKRSFPHLNNTILVVVQGTEKKSTTRSAAKLANRLRNQSNSFKKVSYPEGNPFFKRHFLLYRNTNGLQRLTEALDANSPVLVPAILERSLPGLFDGLSNLVNRMADDQEESGTNKTETYRSTLIREMNRSVTSTLEGKTQPLPWSEVLSGRQTPENDLQAQKLHTAVLLLKPDLSFDSLLPGKRALTEIRTIADRITSSSDRDIRIRLTGDIALQNDELKQAVKGVMLGGTLSLVLVLFILYMALRSMKLVLYSLITLLVGLSWTSGFSAVAIGDLNLISIAFVVLYIGLGIDYAIHFGLIYIESKSEEPSTSNALRRTAGLVGTSLFLCSITTAIGFYAFIPTAYVGISELGLIGGTGMFISLVVTLSVLPALLTLSPGIPARAPEGRAFQIAGSIINIPIIHRWTFLISVLLLAVASGWFMKDLSFEYNPMSLRDPDTESVRTYKDLFDTDSPPSSIHILADSRAEAERLKVKLDALDTVKQVRTLGDFLPDNQQQKRDLLRNLRLLDTLRKNAGTADLMRFIKKQMAGNEIQKEFKPEESSLNEVRSAMQTFVRKIESKRPQNIRTAFMQHLKRTESLFKQCLNRISKGSKEEQRSVLNKLRQALLSRFGRVLYIVHAAATVRKLTEEDLPDRIVNRWKDGNGRYRVDVLPKRKITDNDALRRFVSSVRNVSSAATGAPVMFLAGGKAVVRAFLWAFGIAVLAMSGYLLIHLRRPRDVVFIMIPLLLAGVYICGSMVLLGHSFNYANVIVLPLLLGIGADNSIHIIHRFRSSQKAVPAILKTSTARAVLFSVITTTGSFCNLIFSPHRGMSSMGVVLTVGMGIILFSTMCILPALLRTGEGE